MMSTRGTTADLRVIRVLGGIGTCAALLLTAGCTADDAIDPVVETNSPSASPSSSEPLVEPTVDADALLTIDSELTSGDGARLTVSIVVHSSIEADATVAADARALLLADCGDGFLSEDRLDSESWGLVRVDVTATQVGDTEWPSDQAITLVTSGQEGTGEAAIASSDPLLGAPIDQATEVGPCLLPRTIAGAGQAYYVLGIANDFAGDDIAGAFWSGYRFGVSTTLTDDPIDAEITSCTAVKTPLGNENIAPEVGFAVIDDADECSAGRPFVT